MNKYKVSFIVPVYNLENKISKCADSIINQTMKEIEIIFIDDCSTDNSGKILDNYSANYSNVFVKHLSKNIRQGGARNVGLKLSTGEYVIFIDGDDWIENNMAELMYNYAKKNDLDIVDSDYYQEDEKGDFDLKNSMPNDVFDKEQINKRIISPGRIWTKAFKRELLIENNLFFIEQKKFEDNPYLPIVFAYAKNIGKIDERFYHYIYNFESTSRKKNDFSVFQRIETAVFMLEDAKKRNIYIKNKEEFDYKFIELYFANTIITCITKFNNIPYKYEKEVYDGIKRYVPDYKKNKYISSSPRYIKILVKLNYFQIKIFSRIIGSLSRIGLESFLVRKAKTS